MNTVTLTRTFVLSVALCACDVVAQTNVDDFLVNDDGSSAAQTNPRIAVAASGGFVITWADRRSGENDIYMQRFDVLANPIGVNRRVNDDLVGAWQAEPSIACSFAGQYWMVWKDYRNGVYPFDADVYFQRYDTIGTVLGVNRDLTLEPPDSLKETPDIAVSPTGSAVVVWADYRNSNWDVYGQLIASDGSLIGGNFRVNSDVGAAQQHAPRVAYSDEGWFVVTWYDNRMGHDDIYVRRFDSLAVPLSADVKVNSDNTDTRQAFPDVATDAAGRFTIVWVDWRNGRYPTNPDIYSRTFDLTMTPLNSDRRMNTDATVRAQREPTIAADRLGNVAVIWSDSIGSSFDIVGQMIGADGVVREANFVANSFVDSAQIQADVALDGRFRYITWVDKRNGNFDIYASVQQYNDPTLAVTPLMLAFEMDEYGTLPAEQVLSITHVGYNPIHYQITSSAAWIEVAPAAGMTPETPAVSIAGEQLAAGTYAAMLTLIDTDHADSSLAVPVTLRVHPVIPASSSDTLFIGSAMAGRLAIGAVSIEARLDSDRGSVRLPLRFDTSAIMLDSAAADPALLQGHSLSFEVDAAAGEAVLAVSYDSLTAPIGEGRFSLAEVFFTTRDIDTNVVLDTAYNDTLAAVVIDTSGQSYRPVVMPGEIVVGTLTGVGEGHEPRLPERALLRQNYPNPFNLETTIRFELPLAVSAQLTIHNVLGQEVTRLIESRLAAGAHEIVWDGRDRDGRIVASGVYFYRLCSESTTIARKMVLLK